MKHYQLISGCRACGHSNIESFLDLGQTPLADGLLRKDQLEEEEISAPLNVAFCANCTLVQITATVPPEILFCRDYPYFSSVSKSLLQHFRQSALHLIESRGLNDKSLVIEAASNDGYMLKNFLDRGIPVLGIDPAEGPAQKGIEAGIPMLRTFFGRGLAEKMHAEGRTADVFLANNVLAHVPDLNGFVAGIQTLLHENGVAVIEVPYLMDLMDNCEFDTIYHQHQVVFPLNK